MEIMKSSFLWLVIVVFLITLNLSSRCEGYKFYVGGKDGWVIHPHEEYNHWAERMRFQVNDTLFFKYTKGSDSALVVTRDNYNTCETNNPIKTLSDGDSEYKFERSGPHYFISGNADHCKQGQKIIIVVLAVRPKKSPPTPPKSTPGAPTPAPGVSPSPSPAPKPLAPAPVLGSAGPSMGPSSADSPVSTQDRSSAGRIVGGSLGGGLIVSVAIGMVGVILGM